MKSKVLYAIILILFSQNVFSQLFIQNYATPSLDYYTTKDGRVYFVHDGIIHLSSDQGQTMREIFVTEKPIISACFIDSLNGYSVTRNVNWFTVYEVNKTTNGGISWNILLTYDSYALNSLNFINVNTGWGCFMGNEIVKTTNGGVNWIKQYKSGREITSIKILNANTGFATAFDTLLYTSNGGINWSATYFGYRLMKVKFINGLFGYFFKENNILYFTTNCGLNWSQLNYSSSVNGNTSDAYFLNENTGWISNKYSVYKTTNGGINWTGNLISNNDDILNVIFLNENTGFAGTAKGRIFKTNNGGANWTVMLDNFKTNNRGVSFINNNTGFIVSDGGIIYKTTNKGGNWISNHTCSVPLYAIYTDSLTGCFAVGNSGFVLHSSNYGNNWTQSILTGNLYSVKFINQNTGIICGSSGTIYRTENRGANWSLLTSPTAVNLTGISFANSNTGWISGSNGYILKSTNAGQNWITCYVFPEPRQNYDVNFINESTGNVINYLQYAYPSPYIYSCIYTTTNGGNNWYLNYQYPLLYPYQGQPRMTSINISNTGSGYITATNGDLFLTTNGTNFYIYHNYFLTGLNASCFNNSGSSWVVGDNGLVLSSLNLNVRIRNLNNIVADKFDLSQNYPNPFNPFTKIKFSLPKSCKVEISVYNITGKLIEILANKVLGNGTYEILWDAQAYPSGIYFCKMNSNEFTKSIKMLLIK
jgi:photosystem II stability/assembly factor-like uncharacterized protein